MPLDKIEVPTFKDDEEEEEEDQSEEGLSMEQLEKLKLDLQQEHFEDAKVEL